MKIVERQIGMPWSFRHGVRRRFGKRDSAAEQSPFGTFLKRLAVRGKLKAGEVTAAASASVQSHPTSPDDVRALAKAAPERSRTRRGITKPDTRNTSRSLYRMWGRETSWPREYATEIPLWHSATQTRKMTPMSFMLPWEILEWLVPHGDEQSWASFEAGAESFQLSLEKWAGRLKIDMEGWRTL